MKLLVPVLFCLMAGAQTVPIGVDFTLLDVKDPYNPPYPPLAGETVRLVLGQSPNWQNHDAGHKFVTDEKGEAQFTMDGLIDTHWTARNIGFTPLVMPVRAEHMQIATELEHRIPLEKAGEFKTFRWVLTMDLDCLPDGRCSTVGFMGIYTPDVQGRFTKALQRQGGTESWKVPELNDQVIWGMRYQVADFLMTTSTDEPKKRTLKFAIKRLPRAAR
jgi:hypothetical protein